MTVVRSDPKALRQFFAAWAVIYGSIGMIASAAAATVVTIDTLLPICAIVAGCLILMPLGFVAWWRWRALPCAYRVVEGNLEVLRDDRVTTSFPVEDVRSFELVGAVDYETFFTAIPPPPSWPQARVRVYDKSRGKTRTRLLRPILIWGRTELRTAEADLQAAIVRSRSICARRLRSKP